MLAHTLALTRVLTFTVNYRAGSCGVSSLVQRHPAVVSPSSRSDTRVLFATPRLVHSPQTASSQLVVAV
eukprot:4186720-Alexandrium_andersonii.AAC.1